MNLIILPCDTQYIIIIIFHNSVARHVLVYHRACIYMWHAANFTLYAYIIIFVIICIIAIIILHCSYSFVCIVITVIIKLKKQYFGTQILCVFITVNINEFYVHVNSVMNISE